MNRAAVIGDLHLGRALYGYDLTPHIRRAMYDFLGLCLRERVDCAVCLGDVYDRPTPPAPLRKMVGQWCNAFQHAAIHLYLLTGNHDVSSSHDAPSALESLRVLTVPSYVHVIDRPTVAVVRNQAQILLLPFPSPGIYSSREEYAQEVERVCRYKRMDCAFAHLGIDGVKVSSGATMYRGGDHVLPALSCLSVVGHIHRPQWVSKTCCVLGAAERTAFDERDEDRSFAVLAINRDEGVQVQLKKRSNVLRMVQLEPDASTWGTGDRPPTTEEVVQRYAEQVQGALVKVLPFVDEACPVDWGRVQEGLMEAGALRVVLGPPVMVKRKQGRAKARLASLDPEQAVRLYIRRRVKDRQERKRLQEVFAQVTKEADCEIDTRRH